MHSAAAGKLEAAVPQILPADQHEDQEDHNNERGGQRMDQRRHRPARELEHRFLGLFYAHRHGLRRLIRYGNWIGVGAARLAVAGQPR